MILGKSGFRSEGLRKIKNGTHLLVEINEEKHGGDPLGGGGRLLSLPARQAQRLLGPRNQAHHVLNRYKLLSSLLTLPSAPPGFPQSAAPCSK